MCVSVEALNHSFGFVQAQVLSFTLSSEEIHRLYFPLFGHPAGVILLRILNRNIY